MGLPGGLNREADPLMVEPTQSPDCLNVNFGPKGEIISRKGYTYYDDTCAGAAPGAGAHDARALFSFHVTGGSEYIVSVCETDNAGGAVSDIWAGIYGNALASSAHNIGPATNYYNWHVAFAVLNNTMYLTSLSATGGHSFTGAAWADVTATTFDGTPNRFPVARFLCTHHDRLWAGNILNAATRYPSRVYYSDALTPETWPASQFIDFDPNDGGEIMAMVPFGEALLVLKQHAVHLLTGKSEDSFQRYKVESQIGTECPEGVAVQGGMAYFFDPNTGVWAFDGAQFTSLDPAIKNYMLGGMNRTNIYRAVVWVWDDRLYVSLPWGAAAYPNRTFVLELSTGAWTEYDYGVQAVAVCSNNVLLGYGSRDLESIQRLEYGHYDETTPAPARTGSAIAAYCYTPWMMPQGLPHSKHRTVRLDTIWAAAGDFDMHLESYRDFLSASPTITKTVNTDAGGMTWGAALPAGSPWGTPTLWGAAFDSIIDRGTGWGNHRWRAIQYKFYIDGADESMQLNYVHIVYSSLERVRGEP